MDKIFNKALVITDIHLGRNSNSPVANQDTLDFLDWAIDRALEWGAEICIFMGDWHDNRFNIQISTLAASIIGMEKLNKAFKKIYWLTGNHDLYYKDNRNICSVEVVKKFENIQLINEIFKLEDVTFLPWLVGDEQRKLKIDTRYTFSHLEMGGFYMNSQVVLPDNEELIKPEQFTGEFVFSGHFHKRQYSKCKSTDIVYTGNAFPFNFSDQGDEERGIMLLEYGKDPIFEAWDEQPTYNTVYLSEILKDEKKYLKPKQTVKLIVDVTASHEELSGTRTELIKTYGLRKMDIKPVEIIEDIQEYKDEVDYKDIDQLFIEGLMSIESNGLKTDKLIEIYRSLL